MSSSVAIVDATVPRRTCGAQGHSYPIHAFLNTNTCSAVVCPLTCAFQEEEQQSIRGCPGDEYVTAVISPYILGGVPPPR
jgi:hypothetical protein